MRRRRAAALANPSFPDFLYRLAAEEIAFRIGAMTRTFDRAAVAGAGVAAVGEILRTAGNLSAAILLEDAESRDVNLLADLETLPLAAESLDGFIAVFGLESVNDLPGALVQIRRSLRPDGLFLAAMLGGDTLNELRRSWLAAEAEATGGVSPRVAPFADIRELGGLLQRAGFALPVADVDRHTVRYSDALALMRELRAMGLSNPLLQRSRRPVTRTLLARALGEYAARFSDPDGRVPATFEVVTLTAWAPADSQPKPLKPGSATARLADALGTKEGKL